MYFPPLAPLAAGCHSSPTLLVGVFLAENINFLTPTDVSINNNQNIDNTSSLIRANKGGMPHNNKTVKMCLKRSTINKKVPLTGLF